jgi:hypothetical protein
MQLEPGLGRFLPFKFAAWLTLAHMSDGACTGLRHPLRKRRAMPMVCRDGRIRRLSVGRDHQR